MTSGDPTTVRGLPAYRELDNTLGLIAPVANCSPMLARAGSVPLSSDIRNCTSGDGQKCTTRLVVGSRFEIRREA